MTLTGYTSLVEAQTAIVTLLGSLPAFTSIAGGPYDPAPENTPFPYVTFGGHSELPWLAFGNLGRQVALALHIWSQQYGFSECYSILNVILGALDGQKLTLTHFENVICLYEGGTKYSDPDGITRHFVARFRLWNTAT